MKKIAIMILAIVLIPLAALADLPDLSGLTFEELVQLRDQINLAMWNSQEWQEVSVPPGVWEIGKDIPAGHWLLRLPEGAGPWYVIYAVGTSKNGHDIDYDKTYIMECLCDQKSEYYDGTYKTETDFDMKAGRFIRLDCTTIFTPYTGKPDLGFK